jgi:hypothetical protein
MTPTETMRVECRTNLTVEYLAFIANKDPKGDKLSNESHMAVVMYGVPMHARAK